MIAMLNKWIEAVVWGDVLHKYGLPGRILIGVLRNAYAVLRDIFSGQLTLRAMSLVYTTLLSIVPLIAVSFSALKGFGYHKEFEPYLYNFLNPLGEKGVEITDQVMALVNNVNVNVLGGIASAFFIYTAISMVQKIEESFNYVWYVTKPRSFAKRFVEYTAVLVVGSLATSIAIKALASFIDQSMLASIEENTVLAPVVSITNTLTPYAIVIGMFTFLYMFMPNTNVRFRSALVGGIAGGIMWASTSKLFVLFLGNSTGRQAIYASFAIAITALIWLYLNWLILLIGSQIAFYFQNPAYLRIGRREPRLSNEMRERVALNIMYLIGKEFRSPAEGVSLRDLARQLRIPSITLAPIATGLEASGLIKSNEQEHLFPGREMTRISLREILGVVRESGETGSHREPRWNNSIQDIGARIDTAVAETVAATSLADLLDTTES